MLLTWLVLTYACVRYFSTIWPENAKAYALVGFGVSVLLCAGAIGGVAPLR